MPIKPFKRIKNYFSGFNTIQAAEIDKQFNEIARYLNKEIVPSLNILIDSKIPGSENPADTNKFLQNIGDGTTIWSFINNNTFSDFSISLSKIVKLNTGSILAGNNEGEIVAVNSTINSSILVSRANNFPTWRKLNHTNLKNRAITGDNVADGTITNMNLAANLIENLIIDNSITDNKFQDNSINTSKIADNALEVNKLSQELQLHWKDTVWSNIIPNNYLTIVNQIMKPYTHATQSWETIIRLFNDSTKPVLKYSDSIMYNAQGKPTINTVFPASKFTYSSNPSDGYYWGFCAHHVHGKVNAATKLKDAAIEASRVMIVYKPSQNDPKDFRAALRKSGKEMIANGAVQMNHLQPNLRNKLLAAV